MESTPTPPENRRDFSDQEQHYKSLIDLFKYSVTFASLLFTAIAFVVGFITYRDGKEMRDDQKAARKEIQDNLREMRADIQKERDRLEQLAARSRADLADQQKDINAKQDAIEGAVAGLLTRAGQEISATRTEALRQIGGVKSEAITTARSEARNSINDVFKARNLEDFIESVAKDKLDPKIKLLIDNGIKKASTDFDSQIEESQSLADVTNILNFGSGYVVLRLDTLARLAKGKSTRLRAQYALGEFMLAPYLEVGSGGYKEATKKYEENNRKYYDLTGDSLTALFFKEYLPVHANKPLPSEPTIMKLLYNVAINGESKPAAMGESFALINRLTYKGRLKEEGMNQFDYAALKELYDDYVKRRYPLRMGKR